MKYSARESANGCVHGRVRIIAVDRYTAQLTRATCIELRKLIFV